MAERKLLCEQLDGELDVLSSVTVHACPACIFVQPPVVARGTQLHRVHYDSCCSCCIRLYLTAHAGLLQL
jgi:hypothetical protein